MLFRRTVTFFLLAVSVGATPSFSDEGVEFAERTQLAVEAITQKEDCSSPYETVQNAIDAPAFDTRFTDDAKADVYRAIIRCATGHKDAVLLNQAFRAWRELDLPDERSWSYRWHLYVLSEWNDYERAIDTMVLWLAEPEFVKAHLEFSAISQVRSAIENGAPQRKQPALKHAIYSALWDANYQSPDGLDSNSYFLLDHVSALLELNNTAKAEDIAAQISETGAKLRIHVLLEFEPIREAVGLGADWDIAADYERELRLLSEKRDAHPRQLRAQTAYASQLKRVGKFDEAAQVLTGVIQSFIRQPDMFIDGDEYFNWVLNEQAYTMLALGKFDNATAAFEAAIAFGEDGYKNVSQVINLAATLKDAEQFDVALSTLQRLGDASAFGTMFEHSIKVCAAQMTGDHIAVRDSLLYLENNVTDNFGALQEAYACLDMVDEGVTLMTERLADPVYQEEAFMTMHNTLVHDHELAGNRKVREHFEKVFAHPEVISAASEIGNIVSVPVYLSYSTDF